MRLFPAPESRLDESLCVNTRGWIKLQLGDSRGALEDLEEAVDLAPLGANYLYLALARDRLGSDREAREAARKAAAAARAGELTPHEERLLEDLRAELGE